MRTWSVLAVWIMVAGVGLLGPGTVGAGPSRPPFDLQAHRGGRDLEPENTLASFRHALRLGVTTLEMDIQITRDGIPVVHHDCNLTGETTRDARGHWLARGEEKVIHDLTLAEVKTYDVGGINPAAKDYFAAHGRLQRRCPGERVPTLDEVFGLVEQQGDAKVRFNIETKSYANHPDGALNPPPAEFVRRIMDVVSRHKMEERVAIQSFDWRTLLEMRRLYPKVTRVALTAEVPEWGDEGVYRHERSATPSPWMAGFSIHDFGLDYVKACHAIHANVVSPWFPELTPARVGEAHRRGMQVIPWTVNRQEDMARLLDMGVDGIITDRPDTLQALLDQRGIPYR